MHKNEKLYFNGDILTLEDNLYVEALLVKGNKICKLGKKEELMKEASEDVELIDLEGKTLMPSFIDVHSHNDLVPFMDEEIQNLKIRQGVTTELVGQCGLGVIPCLEDESKLWKNYIKGVVGSPNIKFDFKDVKDYFNKISNKGIKNNYAVLISHGAIRAKVKGFDSSEANENEIKDMCILIENAMRQGAIGMSLGLQYMPGIYSGEKELIELCKIVKNYNGVVMVHVRNHDRNIIKAINEVINIARISGVRIHISHMRSYDSKELGCKAEKLINLVDEAIKNGVDITFDEHLYLSGSTLMTQLLPPWITQDGNEVMLKMLKDNNTIERIKKELEDLNTNYVGWDNYSSIASWDGILITSLNKEENLKYIGRTVGEISREENIHPVNFVANLLVSEESGVGIVTLNIFSEEDTINLIKHPLQMVGSDSIPAGDPHPRLYGNYPLFIGKYIRDKKTLSLEEGIYKCTLLPATTLRLEDRGVLKIGKIADITIFDFDNIVGYEDYINKSKSPKGIKYVIVNGKLIMDNELILEDKNGIVVNK